MCQTHLMRREDLPLAAFFRCYASRMPARVKERPYWHVHLTWLFGLLSVLVLGLALLLFGLYRLASPERAVDFATNSVRAAFRDAAPATAASPLIAPAAAPITTQAGAPNRQAQALAIQQLLQRIRTETRAALERFIESPEFRTAIENAVGVVAPALAQVQGALVIILIIVALLAAASLALTVRFSAGVGRLVSPVVVLVLPGALGLLILIPLQSVIASLRAGGLAGAVLASLLSFVESAFYPLYLTTVLLAVLLAVAAIVVTVVQHHLELLKTWQRLFRAWDHYEKAALARTSRSRHGRR